MWRNIEVRLSSFLVAALFSLFAFLPVTCDSQTAPSNVKVIAPQPKVQQSYKASTSVEHGYVYHIGQNTLSTGFTTCSATAIGPHALLTASHCEVPSNQLLVDGMDDNLTIMGVIRDGNDHSIYLVDYTFKSFAPVNIKDPIIQGEDVFSFGNPAGLSDIMRKGYVAGIAENSNPLSDSPDRIVFDMNMYFGDSGAGVFNDKGELIAVFSQMAEVNHEDVHFKLTYAFPLAFTQDQIDSVSK